MKKSSRYTNGRMLFLAISGLLFFGLHALHAQEAAQRLVFLQPDSTAVTAGSVYFLRADSSESGSQHWVAGELRLTNNYQGLIRISALGFKPLLLDLKEDAVYPKVIWLTPDMTLEEVVVTGQKRAIRQEGNKLIFEVAKSAFAVGGTADEVLKKTPMVMVGSDGTTSVVGKGKATILLDGMPITNDMLQSIPSANIQHIEVISNPGAGYDAAGAAVINLVSKRNQAASSYALIDGSLTKGRKFRESAGIQAGYSIDRWKLDGKYRYYPSDLQYEDRFERVIGLPSESASSEMKQEVEKNRAIPNRHAASLGVDFKATEQLHLHADGNYMQTIGSTHDLGENNGTLPDNASFVLLNETRGGLTNRSGIVSYGATWKSKAEKHRLTIDGSNTWYRYTKDDHIQETFTDQDAAATSLKRNENNNAIDLSMIKADYSTSLNKSTVFDLGAKYLASDNRSSLVFSTQRGAEWIREENEYNAYQYDERILSGYVHAKTAIGKLHIEAGLRVEDTDARGVSQVSGRSLIDSTYVNFFPTASLAYALSRDWDLAANYQKRISRPQYQILNPYRLYIDSLSVYSGNPLLWPELSDAFEAALTFKKFASLKVNYTQTRNAIQTVIRQVDGNSLISLATYDNIDRADALSFTLSVPYQKGPFMTYNIISYTKNFVKADLNGLPFDLRKPFWFFYSYNTLKLPKSWTVELTGSYSTAGLMGIFAFQPKLNISASIKKELIKDKLSVILSANDMFNSDIVRTSTSFGNFDLRYRGFEDNQHIRLAVSYNLGNLKNLTKSKRMDNRIKVD